jgi:hypothetical protein
MANSVIAKLSDRVAGFVASVKASFMPLATAAV